MSDNIMRLGSSPRRLDILAVEQGVEHECPLRPEFYVTVLPAGTWNPRFKRALQQRVERISERNGRPDTDAAEDEFRDRYDDPAFVLDALVLSMRGIYGPTGEERPYTHDIGLNVLADPHNADVLAWIVNQAHLYGRYYEDGLEADAKNSLTGSGGSEAGAGTSEKTPS